MTSITVPLGLLHVFSYDAAFTQVAWDARRGRRALRRRLEAVVPNLGYNVRVSLIESSWAFSCLPELHPVTVTLTETWPGEMPANMACALHKWPEDAFMRLPKVVRWKSALRTIRNSR